MVLVWVGAGLGLRLRLTKKFGKAGKKNLSAAEDGNLRSEKKANKNKPLEKIQGGWKGDISPYKTKKSSRRQEIGREGPPVPVNN